MTETRGEVWPFSDLNENRIGGTFAAAPC